MKFINRLEVESLIENSPPGKNTRFLSAAHSLWTRFHNYEKASPMAMEVDNKVVCLIFATFNRDGYANLYEIVTLEGMEGRGYASKCWDAWIEYASNTKRSTRLKLSCTPSSVTWHKRNGLIFWAVDPSGSLRSDQPLFSTREAQILFRSNAINDPSIAIPPKKAAEQFLKEGIDDHKFGIKRRQKTQDAIQAAGDSWMREALYNQSLEDFLT